jgi:hypothetical protein
VGPAIEVQQRRFVVRSLCHNGETMQAYVPLLVTCIRWRRASAGDLHPLATCRCWRRAAAGDVPLLPHHVLLLKHRASQPQPHLTTGYPDINTNISFCINTIRQRYLFIRLCAPLLSMRHIDENYSDNFTTVYY